MSDAAALASTMAARLASECARLARDFSASGPIRHCVIDGLLGDAEQARLAAAFPDATAMHLRQTFRERKRISAQMDRHDPALADALFAFHEPAVVEQLRDITGKPDLHPDPELYAAGLSRMCAGDFLNPHIDNSHDGARRRWRNLNLLYYVGEGAGSGGELELWPHGMGAEPIRIPARPDRLVVMETHQHAWHSVRPVEGPEPRLCLSNYYFGDTPMSADQCFHVTTFRGRPGQPVRDLASRADGLLRGAIRRLVPAGLGSRFHRFRRD